jgi:hypothetical protein
MSSTASAKLSLASAAVFPCPSLRGFQDNRRYTNLHPSPVFYLLNFSPSYLLIFFSPLCVSLYYNYLISCFYYNILFPSTLYELYDEDFQRFFFLAIISPPSLKRKQFSCFFPASQLLSFPASLVAAAGRDG